MQHALLLLLVATSYLLFAGGPRWTLGPLLVIAAAGVLVAPRRTLRFPVATRPFDLSLVALMLAICVQLIPLPPQAVALLSPHSGAIRQTMQFAAHAPAERAWLPLSIAPGATMYALGTVTLAIVTFWIARALFGAGGHTRRFCRALGVFAATAALVALVHRAVSPTLVLGLLEPDARNANPFGAFLNRNDFAAWLLMASMAAGGYLIAHARTNPAYDRGWRASLRHFLGSGAILTSASVFIAVGVILTTLSRSAAAGLGAAGMTGWLLGRQRMKIERTNLPTVLGLAGGVVLVAVLFVDVDGWATRLEQSLGSGEGSLGRVNIWRETVPVVRDFVWTGTGAGTFSDAMVRYQQTRVWVGSMQQWAHMNNAHSHYLQVASEGGVLLVIPVFCGLAFLVSLGRRAVRADKGEMFWVRVGAAAGLAGIAVQSVWEVALIMPANAVMAGVLTGLLLFNREPDAASAADVRRLSHRRRMRVA